MEEFRLFASLTTAIFLEAAPFLLLGAFVSTVADVYLSPEFFRKYIPKNPFLAMLYGLFAGFVLPSCECGIVPIARRLLAKGVPSVAAISYMLAAPVVNPVVLLSTYTAYQGDASMLIGRVFIVVLTAGIMGWALGNIPNSVLLRKPAAGDDACDDGCGCDSACGTNGSPLDASGRIGVVELGVRTAREFIDLGKYLILGAAAAALFKTFTPQSVLALFQDNVYAAVAAMMLLAVLLSVCSEADAFVAASFRSFPAAAQLGFLTLGPMVDLKLIPLYFAVFHKRAAVSLSVVPVVIIYILVIAYTWFAGGGDLPI